MCFTIHLFTGISRHSLIAAGSKTALSSSSICGYSYGVKLTVQKVESNTLNSIRNFMLNFIKVIFTSEDKLSLMHVPARS